MKPKLFSKIPWRALMGVWLIIVAGSWTADALKGEVLFGEWWHVFEKYPLIGMLLAASVFIGTSLWIWHNRWRFSLARSLSRQRCLPHSSLILLVSPQNPKFLEDPLAFPLQIRTGSSDIALKGERLDVDIEELNKVRWNWQQLLRAIVPHVSRLQRVHLIGSPAPTGSFDQLPLAKTFLERYLPGVTFDSVPTPIDFEDFNVLVERIHKILKEEKERGTEEKDIIIDVTGGFKTASIAAASVTLNSRVTFQYVQTVPPNDVYAYDVIYQPPMSLEG
jgi:hypothetical protein